MLREIGLGLVLMLGGDGEMSRKAGDALIQGKVDEALTEGGFESIAYEDWERGFEGSRFWMGFSGVEVVREGTLLKASKAIVYPISVRMQFSSGEVMALSGKHAWRFDDVEVAGNSTLFSRSLAIYGRDLALQGGDAILGEPFCLFGSDCGYRVSLGNDNLAEFGLDLTRRGREATLRFVWQEGEGCVLLGVNGIRIERGTALSKIGRSMLEEDVNAEVTMEQGTCEREIDQSGKAGALIGVRDAPVKASARWSERDRRMDEVLSILLVSVPEAYEFLVD
ncbi:MAG: hypothetical protein JJU22_14470 [Gammaproteobacteria bacterium]|nr:hypothetical protein [Gammaproteobacteria bacterium]